MALKIPLPFNINRSSEQAVNDEYERADALMDKERESSGKNPSYISRKKKPVSYEEDQGTTVIGDVIEHGRDITLPLIGYMPLQRQIRFLLIGMLISLPAGAFFVWLSSEQKAEMALQVQIAGDALMHSQRIGKAAPNAIQGTPIAFGQLRESQRELNGDFAMLVNGGSYQGYNLSGASSQDLIALNEGEKSWKGSDKAAETILNLEKELTGFGETLQRLNAISPVLLELTEQISNLKVQGRGTAYEISASSKLLMLTQRLGRSANEFSTSKGVSPETAFLLGKDTNTFRELVDGFLNGSEVLRLNTTTDPQIRLKLVELQKSFSEYQKLVSVILGNLQNFMAAKESESLLFAENEDLRLHLLALQKHYRTKREAFGYSFYLFITCFLVALVTAAGIAVVLLQDSRNRAKEANARRIESDLQRMKAQRQETEAKRTNDQNQAAILRLMNELQEVANGDLTIQATVTEDITGAIADSVNYTVEELRWLAVSRQRQKKSLFHPIMLREFPLICYLLRSISRVKSKRQVKR